MNAPVPPYCTVSDVALLSIAQLSPNNEFGPATSPTATQVLTCINLISGQIDNQFRRAGYVIPFLPLPGEVWPTSQTTYLSLTCMLGSAAMANGHIMLPRPETGRDGVRGSNTLQYLYEIELRKIFDGKASSSRFRASTYVGTPAAISLAEPIGPMTDFGQGYVDPYKTYGLHALADLTLSIKDKAETLGLEWNYVSGMLEDLGLDPVTL